MEFKLLYTKSAVKDIKKLDSVAQKRLKKSLERFITKPFFYCEKLIDSRLGQYRFRVGDYRIIFDRDVDKIIILRVGHRKEIYNEIDFSVSLLRSPL
mgnify:CR=1 FL=1